MMKKILLPLLAVALITASAQVMTRSSDTKTYVIDTTTLGEGIRGYAGPVPVRVTIRAGRIVGVEVLDNHETPGYLARVKKKLLPLYEGMKVKDCLKEQPDIETGATFTTRALQENVRLALEHYKRQK